MRSYHTACNFLQITDAQVRRLATEVNLGNTGLIGTIPSQIGLLTNLKVLKLLGYDKLTGGKIPREVEGTKNLLEYLDVNGNILAGKIPREIGRMKNLQYLDLNQNGRD
ncbi:hypothetical protein MHU86_18037 [Fragilaria crotonensis]|nr:hypothetical protein MHU86_18037 [Fragilaria crotonensis]